MKANCRSIDDMLAWENSQFFQDKRCLPLSLSFAVFRRCNLLSGSVNKLAGIISEDVHHFSKFSLPFSSIPKTNLSIMLTTGMNKSLVKDKPLTYRSKWRRRGRQVRRRPYDTVAVTEVRAEEKKNERSLSNIRAAGGRGEEPDHHEKQGLRFVPQSQVLDPPRQRSLHPSRSMSLGDIYEHGDIY